MMSTENTPLLDPATSSTARPRVRCYGHTNIEEDLIHMEKEAAAAKKSNNFSEIEDEEATEDVQEYTRIQEDKLLNAKYKSLDYDTCENSLFVEEENAKGHKFAIKKQVSRWLVMFFVGICTALVACAIDVVIEEVGTRKYALIKYYIDRCVQIDHDCLAMPLLLFCAINAVAVFVACCLVVFVSPCAAGSGIPQIKCYLNGVIIPEVVRVKTLVAKAIGVTFSVIGGLAVGKEGPMIHSGAVIAAGLSQGKSSTFKVDCRILEYFRTDQEKRDFVSGGAAAGVAAAFGAPVGGVLFSLEEGASFWNQALTWRILFASMTTTFTLNAVLSWYHGKAWSFSYPGLISFGKFDEDHSLSYNGLEIPIFMLMGCIGGFLGALFNFINYRLSLFRLRHVYRKFNRIVEAIVVSVVTAASGYLLVYLSVDCKPLGGDPTPAPVQMFCKDGEYNVMASLFLQTPEASVKSLFHDDSGNMLQLLVPSGLFIPVLLVGAAWGRLIGIGLSVALADQQSWLPIYPGKYALLGAAAMLGGVVRMTISLTVILMEATGSVVFGLPIMLVLMTAKWIGDLFNEGLYDIHVQLAGVPFLNWEAPPLTYNISASSVMSHPVVTLRVKENIGRIYDILKNCHHDGFPVVDNFNPDQELSTFGRFQGMILRSQLLVLLKEKAFTDAECRKLTLEDFREAYPRYIPIERIHLSASEMDKLIDLQPFMNPAAYTVSDRASFPRIFRIFRALGLRHVVVIDENHQVVGMVSRSDLARYRVELKRMRLYVEEVPTAH